MRSLLRATVVAAVVTVCFVAGVYSRPCSTNVCRRQCVAMAKVCLGHCIRDCGRSQPCRRECLRSCIYSLGSCRDECPAPPVSPDERCPQ